MCKTNEPLIKGQQPQATEIRGAVPQSVTIIHEGVTPQGGAQTQQVEVGQAGGKPPAHE
jgi:hypothetical protein